jgi:hypothetical protein
MEAMMQALGDDPLDQLKERVAEGFKRMDLGFAQAERRFEQIEVRFEHRFDLMEQRLGGTDARQERLEAKFDDLIRTIIQGSFGLIGTVVVTGGAIVATQL